MWKDSKYYQIKTENTIQKKTGGRQNRIYRQKKYVKVFLGKKSNWLIKRKIRQESVTAINYWYIYVPNNLYNFKAL